MTSKTASIRGYFGVTSEVRPALIVGLLALALVAAAGAMQPISMPLSLALVLVTTGLATLSPFGIVLATVVALPFFYRPLLLGSSSFAASEVLLLAACAGTVARTGSDLLAGRVTWRGLRADAMRVLRSPLIWFLSAIVLAGIVSTIAAYDVAHRSASLRELRWSLIEPLLLVALLCLVVRAPSSRALLLLALASAGIAAAVLGALDVVSERGVVADSVRRLSGPFPHPNALALFLVRPLAVVAALTVLLPEWRKYTVPALGLIGLVLLATFSRGAMLAVLVIAGLLALQSTRRTQAAALAAVVAMTGIAILAAGDRMTSAFEGGSVSLRIDIWTSAIMMIRDSPILGYGPDQFLYAYAPRYILPTAWDERFTAHAHNLLLDSWIRLGIAGAAAAAFALFVVFRRALSLSQEQRTRSWIQTVSLLALTGALVHGLIDNGYFGHDLAMSSWLLAWLAFSPPGSSEQDGEQGA